MKPPKCRLCHKEHWGVCPANKRREQAQESPAALSEGSEGYGGSQPSGNVGAPRQKRARRAQETSPTPEAGVAPGPLTPAEKQRAYRKRIKDDPVRYEKYLEKERARKRG